MLTNPQFPAHLVTFTEDILNGKLYFFVQCIDSFLISYLVKVQDFRITFLRPLIARAGGEKKFYRKVAAFCLKVFKLVNLTNQRKEKSDINTSSPCK